MGPQLACGCPRAFRGVYAARVAVPAMVSISALVLTHVCGSTFRGDRALSRPMQRWERLPESSSSSYRFDDLALRDHAIRPGVRKRYGGDDQPEHEAALNGAASQTGAAAFYIWGMGGIGISLALAAHIIALLGSLRGIQGGFARGVKTARPIMFERAVVMNPTLAVPS